jgi:hypothetical protein
MKKIRVALTCLTFALAVVGVVVAKANENKRTTSATGYVSSSSTFYSITLQSTDFNTTGATSTNQAIIVNGDPTSIGGKPVFLNQGLSTRVIHTIPN